MRAAKKSQWKWAEWRATLMFGSSSRAKNLEVILWGLSSSSTIRVSVPDSLTAADTGTPSAGQNWEKETIEEGGKSHTHVVFSFINVWMKKMCIWWFYCRVCSLYQVYLVRLTGFGSDPLLSSDLLSQTASVVSWQEWHLLSSSAAVSGDLWPLTSARPFLSESCCSLDVFCFWTSAGHLNHACVPKRTDMQPCDWLTIYLH